MMFLFFLLIHHSKGDPSCLTEHQALLHFRSSLHTNALESWSPDNTNLSSWRGLTLGAQGEVVTLELPSLDLQGYLHPVWESLPSLRLMNISNNSLTGTLNIHSSTRRRACRPSTSTLLVLDLSSNRLSGFLSEEVRWLQSLQELHLDRNVFSGELPKGLFQLTSLRILNLSRNNFTGSVTADFHLLREMELLDLSSNNFSGVLPTSSLSTMDRLVKLDLSVNALTSLQTGTPPSAFQRLESLDLSSNSLSGELPAFAFDSDRLQVLNLSRNTFQGPLPVGGGGGGQRPGLRVLDVEFNQLNGGLDSLIRLVSLEHLNLASNNFSGVIPWQLGLSLVNLTNLDVCANALHGTLPESLSTLHKLEQLKLSNNKLSRLPDLATSLPSRLKVLSAGNNLFSGPLLVSESPSLPDFKLEVLYLPENDFSGGIPYELGQLKRLRKLVLNNNRFQGDIPVTLASCELLEEVWINNNRLTGRLPPELFTLQYLRMLVLANNSLSGSPVPRGVSKCKTLEVLWLEENEFSGSISSEAGELTSLLMLSLASNNLTGHVPASLGKLVNLVGLDLGSNALSGRIPDELAGLSSIQFLFLSGNRMEERIPDWVGSLPKLRALDFSFNNFSGSIPSSWKYSTLTSSSPKYSDKPPSAVVYNNIGQRYIGYALPTTLDLSHNQLAGTVPPELGVLKNLQILNLSSNKLQGSIPSTLGNVSALLKLDLSANNLSGLIPSTLSRLTFLSDLNLSYNSLHGEIPTTGQFLTFNNLSFLGNPELCGSPLRACGMQPRTAGGVSGLNVLQKLIPLYVVVAGSLGFCLFWALFIVFIRRRHKLLSDEEPDGAWTPKKRNVSSSEGSTISEGVAWISSNELLAATNNYSQVNIIGDGGFGIVYKAVLADGSVVAVKKLITDGAFGTQGEREFLAEMQTLGKLKHRNLVCLKGYSCDGRDRILVYKYLKNGSLDTWLHCRDEGVKPLDWKTRFGIILGAARGVEFLHHECFPPIVHRDIKASNILLDENFEAHMADFGLARLMRDAGDTHVSTDVAGTVGYIPPEYNSSCMATMRGDVYSFGVVVLETVTGKRPTDAAFRRAGGVSHMVAGNLSMQELQSMVDPGLVADSTCSGDGGVASPVSVSADVLEVMRVACLCCVDKPGKRPEMRHVVRMLEGVEKRHSSSGATGGASSLVTPPSAEGGSKHFLNNVEI